MGIWLWTSVSWDGRAFLLRGSIDGYRSTRWRNHSAQNWATCAVRFRLIEFLPFLLTTAGLFKDQKISVYKFACCCSRDTGGSLGGEDKPQPLQFEARGIWKGVSHWRKVRRRRRTTKIHRTTDVSGYEKREVTQVVGNSAASRSRSSSIFPLWIQIWHSWHSYYTWHLWHFSTLLTYLALIIFLTHFDTLSTLSTAASLNLLDISRCQGSKMTFQSKKMDRTQRLGCSQDWLLFKLPSL